MNLKSKLSYLIDMKAKQLQEDISFLKFASKTDSGYRFLPQNDRRETALQEIITQAAKEYPRKTQGEIQDILAGIVNN
jgi:hypothetical protein